MGNYFVFNGLRSTDFNLFVEHHPAQTKPARKVEAVSIPGRNGSLLIDKGGYENVSVSYACYFRGGPEQASQIAAWLYSPGAAYVRLEDTYHPCCYRMATFSGPLDITNIMSRFGRVTITFDCLPELWLSEGQQPVSFYPDPSVRTYSTQIRNPTPFAAKPLIRLYGDGACTLNIGTGSMLIDRLDEYIDIDCDLGEVYKGSTSCNMDVTVYSEGFLTLSPGLNEIVIAGVGSQTVTKMTIWPRWWTL